MQAPATQDGMASRLGPGSRYRAARRDWTPAACRTWAAEAKNVAERGQQWRFCRV